MPSKFISGISLSFLRVSQSKGQITYVLLTRSPLDPKISLDLHVLSIPPAFILSQDQTLKMFIPSSKLSLVIIVKKLTLYVLFLSSFQRSSVIRSLERADFFNNTTEQFFSQEFFLFFFSSFLLLFFCSLLGATALLLKHKKKCHSRVF